MPQSTPAHSIALQSLLHARRKRAGRPTLSEPAKVTKSHQSQKSKSKSRAKNDVLAAQQDLGIDARTLRELAVKRLERDVKVDEEVVEIRRRVLEKMSRDAKKKNKSVGKRKVQRTNGLAAEDSDSD